jgi:UDP-glucose-4-epimerase GalE
MKNILVTGGAGYIGSHVVKALAERGYTPIVYDNLSGGFRDFVKGHEFIEADIGDFERARDVLEKKKILCVMNFASYIAVGESVQDPIKYYDNNVSRTITLFRAMAGAGVTNFIFSSTAAVYGYPETIPITEESLCAPINPYGRTKYFIEQVLRDLEPACGIKSIRLRYFNAAGADPSGAIGESHVPETHLIPLVMRSLLEDDYTLTVFGTDYRTDDGTCIRDYIHVNDLASAHVLALDRLLATGVSDTFNLGNGRGFSVRQVIDSVRRVTGREPRVAEGPRRPGDPDVLVAVSDRAVRELGWRPAYADIDTIVETAWRWESQRKRKGY